MDARSIAESQRGLRTAASSIRMDPLDRKRRDTGITTKEIAVSDGSKEGNDSNTRLAERRDYGAIFFDILTAVLPLYFVVFGFLSYAQNGTLVDLSLNQVLLRMASFVRNFKTKFEWWCN